MKRVSLLMCIIIGTILFASGCSGSNSLEGRWVRTDGTYIEFRDDGTFASDCYKIFKPEMTIMTSGSPIKEYEGTYNQGEKEITYTYVQRYEPYDNVVFAPGVSSDAMDKDLERTYQYTINDGVLEISSDEETWTFDKE